MLLPFFSEKGDSSVDAYLLDNEYNVITDDSMEISANRRVAILRVKYKGNPKSTLIWYDNLHRIINQSGKYELEVSRDYTFLKINYLGRIDSGIYTLKLKNSMNSIEKPFELVVKGT